MHDLVARQMRRQRLAAGSLALGRSRRRLGVRSGIGRSRRDRRLRLQLFQHQLELLDRPRDLLRRSSELLASQSGDLQLELLDLQRLGQQSRSRGRKLQVARFPRLTLARDVGGLGGDDPMQHGDVAGKIGEVESHARIVTTARAQITRRMTPESKSRVYPAACGCHVRTGIRQSIPSSNMPSCAGVSATLPSAGEGHTKRPFSSRLE
jgi:hypothetical protein